MGCRQCLPLSVVQLKGKHWRKPHCCNGVVHTCGLILFFLSSNAESFYKHDFLGKMVLMIEGVLLIGDNMYFDFLHFGVFQVQDIRRKIT